MQKLSRPAGVGLALIAGSLVSPTLAAAAESGFRVLHHEAVSVHSSKAVAREGSTETMSFEAYGRRFELNLSPNEGIRRGVSGAHPQTVPLQGSVEGIPGSWARVTRSATGLRGLVFDGEQYYAIEPASEVAPNAVQPMTVSGSATVVYRLSDAIMPVETMRCEVVTPDATPESPSTAADALQQLSGELRTFRIASVAALRQVRIGVIGDFEFVSQFVTSQPEDAIVARMNIVDGIFSQQIGVKISLSTPTLFRSLSDPFTKSNASELLDEVKTYRNSQQSQRTLGITHLMTGRNLDTNTVGIAYIRGLCDAQFGSSLSQSRSDTTQAALIAAHEIGHNFGAPHDGEDDCPALTTNSLMAPSLEPRTAGADQFSACSVRKIDDFFASGGGSCLTTYNPPDASVLVSASSLVATVGTPLVASFSVRSAGDDASANVAVSVSLPPGLTVNSVSANGGTCSTSGSTASCNIGRLAAGDTRGVDLNVTPTVAGTLSMNVQLTSTNDLNNSNDTGVITISSSASGAQPPVTPPTGGSSTQSGGGGGGRLDLAVLLALLGCVAMSIRKPSIAGRLRISSRAAIERSRSFEPRGD